MAPAVLEFGTTAIQDHLVKPSYAQASVLIGPKQLNLVRNRDEFRTLMGASIAFS